MFTLTLHYFLLLRYSWDKRYKEDRPSGVDDEKEVKRIRNGKYFPPRRVVHLGQLFLWWIQLPEYIKKNWKLKTIPGFETYVLLSDLKGAPPKLSYVAELLPLLSSSGATDLLIEYEDMFPYWGSLQNISATTAYPMQVCSIAIITTPGKDLAGDCCSSSGSQG